MRSAAAVGQAGPHARSFSLLIEMFAAGQLSQLPGLLMGDHFNAALIANTTPEDDAFLGRTHLPYPVVLVNRSVPGYPCVIEDPAAGTRAAELLVRSKRTRLAVLHGHPLTQTTRTRVDGFLAATNRLLGRPTEVIEAASLSEAGAHDAMTRFFGRKGGIDALYAVTDSLALGAYHAIKRCGYRIPHDISVVGVGDYENAPYFDPPLTCVGVSRDEIGARASQLLLHLLDQTQTEPARVQIPLRTVLRQSTGHKPTDNQAG
jgi:LacI family transcriptional regulator